MSTVEIKDVSGTSQEPSTQGITSGNPSDSSRDDKAGAPASQTVSEVQSLRGEIKVLKDLIFDMNNKYNSNQNTAPKEVYEYPPKSVDEVDARTKMIRKEWGL